MIAKGSEISEELVLYLLKSQYPQYRNLNIVEIEPRGTDNIMYKLGNNLVVRLPRTAESVAGLEKEFSWLPRLAPHLPISIPMLHSMAQPSTKFRKKWAIGDLLPGTNLSIVKAINMENAALSMANFLLHLRSLDTKNAPMSRRGTDLTKERNMETIENICALAGEFDTKRLLNIWQMASSASKWKYSAQWLHGDLHAGNLLSVNGNITGIVDFSLCGVGDPAADLLFAWTVLDGKSRVAFRDRLAVDHDTWLRGIGWAITVGTAAYPYYKKTNPTFAAVAKRAIDEILLDFGDI